MSQVQIGDVPVFFYAGSVAFVLLRSVYLVKQVATRNRVLVTFLIGSRVHCLVGTRQDCRRNLSLHAYYQPDTQICYFDGLADTRFQLHCTRPPTKQNNEQIIASKPKLAHATIPPVNFHGISHPPRRPARDRS